jgi:catechol 2,3-dioxygenase-like lactoylglutathione lyase family enzyme
LKVPSCFDTAATAIVAAEVLRVASVRLYRVIVPVDDIDRAAQFYRSLLGQDGMRISPGRHYFGVGGVILALYNPKADGDATQPRPNFDHVYFAVDDLDEIYHRAERAGGLSQATGDGNLPMGAIARRPWGERSFYMQDPFGNPLCFVDASTVFTAGLVE